MLRIILLLFVFVAVNTLITWWLMRKKTGTKFSGRSLGRLLGIGALTGILPVVFGLLVPDFHGMHPLLCGFLTGFLEYALVKEISKYFALRFAARDTAEIVCRYDVVIAACLIAVGFTLTEGIITMFFLGANGLMMTILPYHILFAVVMGFFYSRSLAAGSAGDRILSLVIPIILHTVFELWHFALIEAAGGPRMGSMTTEQVMALPYLSLIQPLSVISGVSYAVFVVLTVIAFVLIGRWGKKGKLRERIDR